jgi:hypothetical protein
MTRSNRTYWVTPAAGVAVGLIYLIAFSLGGTPGYGLIAWEKPATSGSAAERLTGPGRPGRGPVSGGAAACRPARGGRRGSCRPG